MKGNPRSKICPPSNLERKPALLLVFCIAAAGLWAQKSAQPQPQNAPPQPASQSPSNSLTPLQLNGNAALHHLNSVIGWYRHSTSDIHPVGLPTDTIYQENVKSLGAQVVQLAFQSAQEESKIIVAQQKSASQAQSSVDSQQQSLEQMRAKTNAKIDSLQSQIENLNAEIAKKPASRRTALISQRDALQSQLDLQKALLDGIQKMASFVEANGELPGGVEGDINRLAKSIPEVLGTATAPAKPSATPAPAKPTLANSGGLISEAMTLYDYTSSIRQIDGVIQETDDLRQVADQLRTPLRRALRATIQTGQQLANQPPATDLQQLNTEKQTLQALTDRFKQLSAALLPLSQELILLDESKTNLNEWRNSVSHESKYILRSVLLRVLGILLALGVILAVSEIWRRITFRYVTDPRRRRQFLVLRRVVTGFLIAVVLVLGFVSEFSSLATFAGFITAGIAVGLQAVLLSVAAYFFVIGRYGIHVGDRISVAGITGDVVDIGLVRLYLMELAGTGLDFYPTGRIVVFSNSVLFQAGTPLFKQIPGTEYAWHEVAVMVAPNGDHKLAQEKLVATVNSVYSKYQQEIERQHDTVERRADIQVETPRPAARLQFADAGLELLVRYPVEIRNAPNIDEEMTRRVLDVIETDPALKATVSGTPKIRSAIKG